MTDKFNESIKRRMKKRIEKISFFIGSMGIDNIYVAGNSLNRSEPNDIDLFPTRKGQFDNIVSVLMDAGIKPLSKTKNAVTIKKDEKVIQFCKYYKGSLISLIESFDFSHVQIGCKVEIDKEDFNNITVGDPVYTEHYTLAKMTEMTTYIHSEYPLSSLIRLFKYKERGDIPGRAYMMEVFKIITSIVERGFKNHDDFKDQLDAVDLGLIPAEVEELKNSMPTLDKLFDLLCEEESE